MGVDAHVPRCATKTLSFSIRDVLFWLGITVLLGHSKIHNVYDLLKKIKLVDMEKIDAIVSKPFAPLVPGRPTRKLSGLISR